MLEANTIPYANNENSARKFDVVGENVHYFVTKKISFEIENPFLPQIKRSSIIEHFSTDYDEVGSFYLRTKYTNYLSLLTAFFNWLNSLFR